ncbi:hypothetical protein L2E82_34011 [Cichorium intybus]|uniref:Uncharacterized protein n=1 Tax=Cichorium intybus TaxID=13427 RepID=A0ACB9BLG4_CICIN|nr:hypothetical protein L2E82_34011 [Cichorium intybus]
MDPLRVGPYFGCWIVFRVLGVFLFRVVCPLLHLHRQFQYHAVSSSSIASPSKQFLSSDGGNWFTQKQVEEEEEEEDAYETFAFLLLGLKPDRNMAMLDDYEMEELGYTHDPNHRSVDNHRFMLHVHRKIRILYLDLRLRGRDNRCSGGGRIWAVCRCRASRVMKIDDNVDDSRTMCPLLHLHRQFQYHAVSSSSIASPSKQFLSSDGGNWFTQKQVEEEEEEEDAYETFAFLLLGLKPDRNMAMLDDYEMEELGYTHDPNHRSDEENPSDYQVVPGFRARIIPVLGTIPAIFGQIMALYVDVEEVMYVAEELWHRRSARDESRKEVGCGMWRFVNELMLVIWDISNPSSVSNPILLKFTEVTLEPTTGSIADYACKVEITEQV